MRKKIMATIISLFYRKFYCTCGYKTNSQVAFTAHINQHPNVPGHVDFETGAIAW